MQTASGFALGVGSGGVLQLGMLMRSLPSLRSGSSIWLLERKGENEWEVWWIVIRADQFKEVRDYSGKDKRGRKGREEGETTQCFWVLPLIFDTK